MSKKRARITNPEPFLPMGSDAFSSAKKRSKPPKHHQLQEHLVPTSVSSKILKEARRQQKEIQDEEDNEANVADDNPNNKLAFSKLNRLKEDGGDGDDSDLDDFDGFSETQSQFGQWDVEDDINEEDEKLLESFLSKDEGPKRTLADIIVQKIKEKDAQVASGAAKPMPKLDDSVIELYKGVGKLLSKYTSGKIPKAFKHVSAMQYWEEVLYLTEPDKWSPNAMYQATRLFASNMSVKKVERFYKYVLLPRVREDIRKNKRLHFALYQSLKKAIFKPAAFNKGIIFPLCESRTCTLREAVIIGSILEKISIPPLHSSVALLKLAEMEYYGTTSYFIKILIEKKYALPYRVLDALVAHFMKFYDDSREMPVIWHQSLLAFAQRYKNELTKENKADLNYLVERQRHKLVTPEILRELNNSRNRGEKEDDPMSISAPLSIVNRAIEEDRFDIPDVPMEED